jgi:hypothetical protein
VRWDRRAYLNDILRGWVIGYSRVGVGGIITASGDVDIVTSASEDVNSGLDS